LDQVKTHRTGCGLRASGRPASPTAPAAVTHSRMGRRHRRLAPAPVLPAPSGAQPLPLCTAVIFDNNGGPGQLAPLARPLHRPLDLAMPAAGRGGLLRPRW